MECEKAEYVAMYAVYAVYNHLHVARNRFGDLFNVLCC